eukprot:TRINITY_DN113_c0_g1_i1.p1 TRINITY_DN113_c0_g1~~TRINITY_DN113_c0_g1_i1.p1  ORF type:complete len:144 (-),score=45.21 TRINITY_DN113_c0_g1_i1:172-555(-)
MSTENKETKSSTADKIADKASQAKENIKDAADTTAENIGLKPKDKSKGEKVADAVGLTEDKTVIDKIGEKVNDAAVAVGLKEEKTTGEKVADTANDVAVAVGAKEEKSTGEKIKEKLGLGEDKKESS